MVVLLAWGMARKLECCCVPAFVSEPEIEIAQNPYPFPMAQFFLSELELAVEDAKQLVGRDQTRLLSSL
jgi:hypothetical protein